jgi:hypothetical protein
MNVVQLEARLFRELTPSLKVHKVMSGIPQIPIIVSQKQNIGYVMPNINIIACKLGQKSKPSKRRNQSKSGQATYMVPMSI